MIIINNCIKFKATKYNFVFFFLINAFNCKIKPTYLLLFRKRFGTKYYDFLFFESLSEQDTFNIVEFRVV